MQYIIGVLVSMQLGSPLYIMRRTHVYIAGTINLSSVGTIEDNTFYTKLYIDELFDYPETEKEIYECNF